MMRIDHFMTDIRRSHPNWATDVAETAAIHLVGSGPSVITTPTNFAVFMLPLACSLLQSGGTYGCRFGYYSLIIYLAVT
jgi:hypothetical protein